MCQQETQVSIPPTRGTEVAAQRGCIRAADHGTVNMACPLANQVHKSLPTGTGSTLPSTNVNSRPPCGCPPADDHGGYRPDAAGGGLFASAAPGRAGKRAHTIPMECCCPDRIRLKIPGRRGRARGNRPSRCPMRHRPARCNLPSCITPSVFCHACTTNRG